MKSLSMDNYFVALTFKLKTGYFPLQGTSLKLFVLYLKTYLQENT